MYGPTEDVHMGADAILHEFLQLCYCQGNKFKKIVEPFLIGWIIIFGISGQMMVDIWLLSEKIGWAVKESVWLKKRTKTILFFS